MGQYGLNDVDLEYSDADYTNLTTYKLFQQNFRPRIQAENPKVPMSKLMMLVAAKWREFTALAPKDDDEAEDAPLSKRKGGRGRGTKKKVEEEYLDFEDDSDEETPKRKPRGGGAAKGGKKGVKGKKAVPKLKIKLGGRKKKGSSDDEDEESDSDSEKESKGRARKEKNNDSDEEFEQMLKAAERVPPEDDDDIRIEKEKVKKPKK